MSKIAEKEKTLFAEWRENRAQFSEDGMVDIESYKSCRLKLLFLLKEVNSESGFNLVEFIRKGGRNQTWGNIARWIYGIQQYDKDINWKDLDPQQENRVELLKSICVMNLKKTPGKHTTNSKDLWRVAKDDKEFIIKQFHIYFDDSTIRPDFIIGCGSETFDLFNSIVEVDGQNSWKLTSKGILYYSYDMNKYFIKYAHPEARVQDSILCYGLIDAVRELKSLENK